MNNNPEKNSNIESEAINVPRQRVYVIRRAVAEAMKAFEEMGITNRHYVQAAEKEPAAQQPQTETDSQPMPDTHNVNEMLAYAQSKARTIREQSEDVQEAA